MHKYLFLDIEKEVFQNILIENCKLFPVKIISNINQQPFIQCANQILEARKHGQDTTAIEQQVDELVYHLYGIMEEERKVIEGA